MRSDTTVNNTDGTTVQHEKVSQALGRVNDASNVIDLGTALEGLCADLGLPNYLMLHLQGADLELKNVIHNLQGLDDVASITNHAMTAELLASRLPVVLDGQFDHAGLQAGIAVAVPHSHTWCVLMAGAGPSPMNEGSLVERMGLVCMAASCLVDRLRVITPNTSPLSDREISCLCYAAIGASAKETARELGISPRTVEEYNVRCRRRLGAKTMLEAVVQALRRGWISDADIAALESISYRRRYGAG